MVRRPLPVTKLLSGSHALNTLLAQARRQQHLCEQIRRLLPAPLDRHLRAALLKGRHLYLYADSSAWSSRLRFYSRQLQKQLAGAGIATDRITLRVMRNDPAARVRRRKQLRRMSADTAALIGSAADGIDDPGLSAALRRLARHHD